MRAAAKYVRIAPRKARLVADAIRGKSYPEAVSILLVLANVGIIRHHNLDAAETVDISSPCSVHLQRGGDRALRRRDARERLHLGPHDIAVRLFRGNPIGR